MVQLKIVQFLVTFWLTFVLHCSVVVSSISRFVRPNLTETGLRLKRNELNIHV